MSSSAQHYEANVQESDLKEQFSLDLGVFQQQTNNVKPPFPNESHDTAIQILQILRKKSIYDLWSEDNAIRATAVADIDITSKALLAAGEGIVTGKYVVSFTDGLGLKALHNQLFQSWRQLTESFDNLTADGLEDHHKVMSENEYSVKVRWDKDVTKCEPEQFWKKTYRLQTRITRQICSLHGLRASIGHIGSEDFALGPQGDQSQNEMTKDLDHVLDLYGKALIPATRADQTSVTTDEAGYTVERPIWNQITEKYPELQKEIRNALEDISMIPPTMTFDSEADPADSTIKQKQEWWEDMQQTMERVVESHEMLTKHLLTHGVLSAE